MSQAEGTTKDSDSEIRIKKVADAIRKDLDPYYPQLKESFVRVTKLISLARSLANQSSPASNAGGVAAGDVLRSAVVLTHAFLEDFLRTLANRLLPECDENALKDIPLAGSGRGKSQFHLGQLAQHRQKTVDAIIRESVSEHLERTTFNTTTDIAHLLERLHLDVHSVEGDFPALDRMIRRRHQIVHRADRVKEPNSNTYTLETIQLPEVQSWLEATWNFTMGVVSRIAAESVMEILEADPPGRR